MFEVGFTEIILIFGIALLVLGPARLPKLAADLGRWAGRARAMARQLRTQLEQEVHFDPLATGTTSRPTASHGTIHTPAPASTPDVVPETAAPPPADAGPVEPVEAPPGPPLSTDTTTTVPDERKPG